MEAVKKDNTIISDPNIEDIKLANVTVENENSYYKCSSCKVYIVFMMVVFIIFIGITIYFVYYN